MECPVQCGYNAHAAPGFFIWQELLLKHPERMRSPMPQAAFYGDWGVSPTSRKSLSCHESPACRRVDSKKSFKIWKNFRLILFVSWSRIQMRNFNLLRVTLDIEKEVPYGFHDD